MPYKIDTCKMKLPRKLDRRIKLTNQQRIEIANLFNQWYTQTRLALIFEVHRKTIRNIVYPEKYQADLKRRIDGKCHKLYYNREKNTQAVKNTRRYRQKNKEKLI